MSRHYAGSKPFVWLRKKLKVDKPTALPFGQWDVWENKYKKSRPVAYFLTETLPDWLELPARWIVDPIDDAIYYLRRRFIYRSHYLHTGLKPGRYYDLDTRFLHGMFNSLVDYVEEEKAWANVRWDDEEQQKNYHVPWWVKNWYFRWSPWRCQQAGIDHLHWEMGLDDNGGASQADAAYEIYILYIWWKEIRSKRNIDEDAWKQSGLKDFYDRMDVKYGEHKWGMFSSTNNLTSSEKQEYSHLQQITQKLEESWQEEDDQMLGRLVKIRRSMWT